MTELPRGWAWGALEDLGRWVGGGTPSKAVAEYWTGDIPWVSPKDMKVERIADAEDHISASAVEESTTNLIPSGAVLVVTRSGILRHTLPVAVTERAVTLNQDLKALIPGEGIEPSYLAWALRANASSILRECSKAGTTVSNIETARLLNFRIPIAPPAEQRRIVGAIEALFSRVDAADAWVAHARRSADLLQARLLESVSAIDAPRVPVGSLIQAGRKIAYGVLQPGPHVADGIPLVRVGNIVGFRVTGELKRVDASVAGRYPRTRLQGGEVLLTVVGTIGRTAVVPPELESANVARAVSVIPLVSEAHARFVALALGSPTSARELTLRAHEVARKTLNLEDVRRFEIPLPPLEQQRAIADETDAALACVQALGSSVERAGRRAESLRRSILARAFRGELVAQDPADQPASELLERIAAQRIEAPRSSRKRRERAPA